MTSRRPFDGIAGSAAPSIALSIAVSVAISVAVAVLAGGCAATRESGTDGGISDRRPAESTRLSPAAEAVGTVQLYRTGGEDTLPLVGLGTGETLTLAFDLVEEDARPLSVWFYHTDRTGRRDLVPAEFMASFHRDDLMDYFPSRATQVPYVHYRYEFPNASMRFRISGHYVIRVTEQGDEDAVLFERPFWLSEQAVPLRFGVEPVMVAGANYPSLQPTVEFAPPDDIASNAYDYTVCFVRAGRTSEPACNARPNLSSMPSLRYYLEAEDSFAPRPDDWYLDVSELRIGPRIVSTDFAAVPFRVALEPDYVRFPGSLDMPLAGTNPVVDAAVRTQDPSLSAEYVRARFALVPDDERAFPGEVHVVGTFNGWIAAPDCRMEWNPAAGRYEAELLVKQGRHAYRYAFSDPRVEIEVYEQSPPRLDEMVTAFVYFRDVRLSTDRLVSTVSARPR